MKKFVIFAMLALFLGSAIGAEKPKREYRYGDKGYFGTVRAGYTMWSTTRVWAPAIDVEVINGYSFNPWFMLGGGVGITHIHFPGKITSAKENRCAVNIPLYLHLRTNILDRKVAPIVALNVGGQFYKGYLPKGYGNYEVENCTKILPYTELQLGAAVRLKGGKMIDFGFSVPGVCHLLANGLKFSFGYTW